MLLSFLLSVIGGVLQAQELFIYPSPHGVASSTRYEVRINDNPSFVYMTTGPKDAEFTKDHTASWTSFDFRGKVDIRIRRLDCPVQAVTIRPKSAKIEYRIDTNGDILLQLDRPRKIAVECDNDLRDVLFLFANEPDAAIPSLDDPNVVWFDAGVHDIGTFYPLKTGTTYYLAPGAYLKGSFAGGGDGTRVIGRGVLSGQDYKWPGHLQERNAQRVDLVKLQGNDIQLEGVTLVDSPYYVIIAEGKRTRLRNVKVIAWHYNTDAVSSGTDAVIDDCFFRAADDIFKPYVSNTLITRCVIWADRAAAFQLTWGVDQNNSGNSVVRDCDVIHHMPFMKTKNKWGSSVFMSWHGGPAHIQNILFEDIRIEGQCPALINIFMKRNPWGPQEGTWGSFSGLTFRNISVEKPFLFSSRLLGQDESAQIENVLFENMKIAGTWIRSAEDMNLETNAFVKNVRFVVTQP